MVGDRLPVKEPPREFAWDVESFLQAQRAGVFKGNDRYELIDGRLLEMPTEQPHSIVSTLFFQALATVFAGEWLVWTERPLRLHPRTRPTPDVCVVPGPLSRWFSEMPSVGEARLIVEVAASTLQDDLGRKAELYALAAVPEYWVVDVYGDRLLIHTEPRGGSYRSRREMTLEDIVPYIDRPLAELIPVRYERTAFES